MSCIFKRSLHKEQRDAEFFDIKDEVLSLHCTFNENESPSTIIWKGEMN